MLWDPTDEKSVPEKARRWYVRHVEPFFRANPGVRAVAVTATQVEGYCKALSAQAWLEDWQLRQAVDALRILLVIRAPRPADGAAFARARQGTGCGRRADAMSAPFGRAEGALAVADANAKRRAG